MTETKTKRPFILAVGGIKGAGTTFLVNSLKAILELSGHTVTVKEKGDSEWDKADTDFIIIRSAEFVPEIEAKADLVFTSTRNEEALSKYYEEGIYGVAAAYREVIRWMRSNKLAYCMDCDLAFNNKGLHNYSNFRFMILPMNYRFGDYGLKFNVDKDGKTVTPASIIETVMPEFKELSAKANEKLNQVISEKVEKTEEAGNGEAKD